MNRFSEQRAMALITVLGILALFLLVSLLILTMTSQNSANFGNAYQKQRYYDVAEAGIDRGLKDLDSVLPSPGAAGFLTATPPPPPATPSSDQTPLPNVPNVPYHYSYWFNSGTTAVSTPDPLRSFPFGPSSTSTVNVPAKGAVIWSYTTVGVRDVAAETVVSRFGTSGGSCAICAGQSVTVTGSDNISAPPVVCGSTKTPYKVCSDPNASPAPTAVPIVMGGTYTCSGAEPAPCAYGDGTSTPNPTQIQQSAPSGKLSGFLASQGSIDQLGDSSYWKDQSTLTSNVKWIDCTSGCDAAALTGPPSVVPSAGQVTFVLGSLNLSSKTVLSYGGTFIVSQCLNISQPGMKGTGNATTIVLGTDSQCGGSAVATFAGGGNSKPPLWDGGLLYAAQGSVNIAGNGSVKGYNFYGAIIAAGSVTVTGNGYFAWESGLTSDSLNFGPFTIASFAQY
jgi:hypothetical protein